MKPSRTRLPPSPRRPDRVTDPLLDLLDYRRRVDEMYQAVRALRDRDPRAAHRLWRERRDDLFRTHPQSALPPEKRAAFRGLPYHDYDPERVSSSWRVSPY